MRETVWRCLDILVYIMGSLLCLFLFFFSSCFSCSFRSGGERSGCRSREMKERKKGGGGTLSPENENIQVC